MFQNTFRRWVAKDRRAAKRRTLDLECLESRVQPASLAVASFFDSALYMVDSSTGTLQDTLLQPLSTPVQGLAGMTGGPDGNLYLSSQFGNEVYKYDVAAQTLTPFLDDDLLLSIASTLGVPDPEGPAPSQFAPSGLAFGPDGDLYVTLNGGQSAFYGGAVLRFDVHLQSGALVADETYAVVAGGLIQPSGLTFGVNPGDTHSLYVSNSALKTVVKVSNAISATPASSVFVDASASMNFPSGLAWGPDGKFYLADLGATNADGNLYRFNADGSGSTLLTTVDDLDENFYGINGNLFNRFPAGLAFDGLGHVLTANLGPTQFPTMLGSVSVFGLDGTFVDTMIDSSAIPDGPELFPGFPSTGFAPSQIAILPSAPPSVIKDTTTLTGTPTPQTLLAGGSSTLVVTVTANGDGVGTPTGSVSFSIDGGAATVVTVVSGQATLDIAPLAVGVHGIVATYSGDSHFAVSSLTTTQTVAPTLVVSSFFDSGLYVVDSITGDLLDTLLPPLATPVQGISGMTVGPDGNLYLSSQFGNEVYKYDVAAQTLTPFLDDDLLLSIANTLGVPDPEGPAPPQFAPSGLAFGPDGDLYVTLNGGQSAFYGGAVLRFDVHLQSGALVADETYAVVAGGLIQPSGLAFGVNPGDTHSLYVSNSALKTVVKVSNAISATPTSSVFVDASSSMNFPSGLAWGPDGKFYLADLGATNADGNLYRFNADGSGSTLLTTVDDLDENFYGINGNLFNRFPAGLAFDGLGHVLTANLGPTQFPSMLGSVSVYGLDGTFVETLIDSSSIPDGPELFPGFPSTGFAPSQIAILPSAPPSVIKDTTTLTGTPTPQTLLAGGASTLVVTVSANGDGVGTPTGSVSFSIDGGAATVVTVVSGQATLNIAPLPVGVHTIVATYSGDSHFAVSSLTTTQTVAPTLVVSSFFDSGLYVVDSLTGDLIETLLSPLASPVQGISGMTVGPDGNLYLSSQFGNEVYVYDVTSQTLTPFLDDDLLLSIANTLGVPDPEGPAPPQFAPSGLAFGPDGDLYVTLNGGQSAFYGGAVLRFDVHLQSGALVADETYAVVAGGLIQPSGLAFGVNPGDTHSLYVSNSALKTVVKVSNAISATPTSSVFVDASSSMNFPSGLAWGPDGKFYLADLGATNADGNLYRFNADGSGSTLLTTVDDLDENFYGINGNLFNRFPAGLAFDGLGHVLTANLGPTQFPTMLGSVSVFGLDGTFVETLIDSSSIPDGPELFPGFPSTGFAPSQIAILPSAPPSVVKDTTALTGTPTPTSPSTLGQAVSWTVTVSANGGVGTPTGSVTFSVDGGSATNVSLVSGQATFNVPSLAIGVHSLVALYTGDGSFAISTKAATQIVEAAPTVTSVAPFVGPTSGGVTVIIVGTSFTSTTQVTFDGVDATFTVNSATQITATVPAHALATVDVVVTNARGSSSGAGTANDFTYAAPAIASVVVNGGSIVARDRLGLAPVLEGQSSVVSQILVTFNQRVRLDADAFTIVGQAVVSATVATPSLATVAVNAAGVEGTGDATDGYTEYVLTFAAGAGVDSRDNAVNAGLGNAFTTLQNGFYQLNFAGSKGHAGASTTAADHTDTFWALYGAVNPGDVIVTGPAGGGDDTLAVDGLALSDIYATFGSQADGVSPVYVPGFDRNLDGFVDGVDLGELYANFGTIWQF